MPGDLLNMFSSQQTLSAGFEANVRNQLLAAQNQQAARFHDYANLLPQQIFRTTRPLQCTPADELFLKIPSVAYLIEKIPAARVVIAKDGVTAAYLNEAKAAGLSLRRQCNDLGIPWTSRLLAADEVTEDAVRVAAFLSPSIFSQTKPKGAAIQKWANWLLRLHAEAASESVISWVAWHVEDIGADDLDYLRTVTSIAPSTKPETIRQRSREWHDLYWQRRDYALLGRSAFTEEEKAKLPKSLDGSSIEFDGYSFVPLKTYGEFVREGVEMRHCVSSRFAYAKRGDRVYFSIHSGGRSLATAEYVSGPLQHSWHLSEIKSRQNAAPPSEVKKAAAQFEDVLDGKIVAPSKAPAQTQAAAPVVSIPQKAEYDSKSWTG